MAQRDACDSFWCQKRQVNTAKQGASGIRNKGLRSTIEGDKVQENTTSVPRLDNGVVDGVNMKVVGVANKLKRVVAVVDEEKLKILRNCVIGYCRRTCSMLDLAKEFRAAGLEGIRKLKK
ncbi:hypothetical protein V6N13_092486 [Hibiscus sabdariffa]|uniref:Uncharacterized protein n=2 Tax=Hibiscus sabdariffa TaxID=183260 RepID=A0ABR2CCI4_9ROSI